MKCPSCKKDISNSSRFCNYCGSKIDNQGKICQNSACGKSGLPEEALFCPDCGSLLSKGFESFIETVNGVDFVMVAINGGSFLMGSPPIEKGRSLDEFQHKVTLSDYFISETPVTQSLWESVVGRRVGNFKGDNNPVESISWNRCQDFIERLKQLTEKKYQLPTEAQWEFAARGGICSKGFIYSGSNDLDNVGFYIDNCYNKTFHVKSMLSNELGIYDMSGNVWEWCQDWYGEYDRNFPTDPQGVSSGELRVFRGGSWSREPKDCRNANRCCGESGLSRSNIGFRLALSL